MTSEFHLFGKLPLELRDQIWREAGQAPHIICVNIPHLGSYRDIEFSFSALIPAVLHVNRESRHQALKCFRLLPNYDYNDQTPQNRARYFYISSYDIIHIFLNYAVHGIEIICVALCLEVRWGITLQQIQAVTVDIFNRSYWKEIIHNQALDYVQYLPSVKIMEFVLKISPIIEEMRALKLESSTRPWTPKIEEGAIRLLNEVGRAQHFQKNGLWEELNTLQREILETIESMNGRLTDDLAIKFTVSSW